MEKISEYDVVVANKMLNDKVLKGSRGTVLIIYEDGKHYEVEFIDVKGNTLGVLTVHENDVEKWVAAS